MENLDIYFPPESYILSKWVIMQTRYGAVVWNDRLKYFLAELEYHDEFETFKLSSLIDFYKNACKWPKEKQSLGYLTVELYRWIAKQKGLDVRWVGDKTPLNTLKAGLMHTMFPNAVFIYIERDGIDVVDSYVEAGIYTSHIDAARRWIKSRKSWHKLRKRLPKGQYYEIKYELLVKNYNQIISDIKNKFDIPLIHNKAIPKEYGDVEAHAHHKRVSMKPDTSSIGKGRRNLLNKYKNSPIIKELGKIMNKELVKAGYEPFL